MTDKMNLKAANARPSPPSITGEPGKGDIARATGGVGDRASSPARDNSLLPERMTLLSSGESRKVNESLRLDADFEGAGGLVAQTPDTAEPAGDHIGDGNKMGGPPFQSRVDPWLQACFGAEIAGDQLERGDRLLEEVFELLQAGEYPRERIASLSSYVWSRPAGEPSQEVGGVMVTLAAYCLAHGLDMHDAGETELARVGTNVEKIRAKQAAKPVGSALPQAWPIEAAEGDLISRVAAIAEILGSSEIDSGDKYHAAHLLRALPAAAQGEPVAWPAICDGIEQDAFEAWAKDAHFDMTTHPLHWLFLDRRTYAARDGWKAGIAHAVERMKVAHPSDASLRAEVERLRAMLSASDDRLRETEMRLTDATNAYRMTRVERDAARDRVKAAVARIAELEAERDGWPALAALEQPAQSGEGGAV